MKIGILTFSGAMNYGAQAQLYAMTNFIKSEGHEVTILYYTPNKYWIKTLKMSLRNEQDWLLHPIHILQSLFRMMIFYKWIKKIPNKKTVKNGKDIDSLELELVVLGSDEILNCVHPFFGDIYLGVGINTPKVYYAPSSGALMSDYIVEESFKNDLGSFNSYSARDYSTQAFLKNNINKEITMVLDPTFLWDFSEIKSDKIPAKGFILLYSFDSLEKYKNEITEYAESEGLSIISLARSYKWADYNLPIASECDWLTCFKNSELVITDSYHGLVFAIKNYKEFVLMPRTDKLNKNEGLLLFLSVSKNYYKFGPIKEYLMENSINYDDCRQKIEERINISKDYLRKAIGGI